LKFESECVGDPHVVTPGLDPGVHQFPQKILSKKMDHRVQPGDDDLKIRSRMAV
jgi:hypothetical protein